MISFLLLVYPRSEYERIDFYFMVSILMIKIYYTIKGVLIANLVLGKQDTTTVQQTSGLEEK